MFMFFQIRVICRRSNVLYSPLADYMAWHISLTTGFLDPFLYGLVRKKIRASARAAIKNSCVCWATSNKVHPSTLSDGTLCLGHM